MVAAPNDPPATTGDGAAQPPDEARPVGAPQSFGPLIVRPFTKSDGRNLILYERSDGKARRG